MPSAARKANNCQFHDSLYLHSMLHALCDLNSFVEDTSVRGGPSFRYQNETALFARPVLTDLSIAVNLNTKKLVGLLTKEFPWTTLNG